MCNPTLYRRQTLMVLLLLQFISHRIIEHLGVQATGSPLLLSEGGGKGFGRWIFSVCSRFKINSVHSFPISLSIKYFSNFRRNAVYNGSSCQLRGKILLLKVGHSNLCALCLIHRHGTCALTYIFLLEFLWEWKKKIQLHVWLPEGEIWEFITVLVLLWVPLRREEVQAQFVTDSKGRRPYPQMV